MRTIRKINGAGVYRVNKYIVMMGWIVTLMMNDR